MVYLIKIFHFLNELLYFLHNVLSLSFRIHIPFRFRSRSQILLSFQPLRVVHSFQAKAEVSPLTLAMFVLATGTIHRYGLNRIFEIAKELEFEGIEIFMNEVYDTYDKEYLK